MPRPTDVATKATAESRRKGPLAANAKRRELGLSLRERIARQLERRAEDLAGACVDAAIAGELDRLRRVVGTVEAAVSEGNEAGCAQAEADALKVIPPAEFSSRLLALSERPSASAREASGNRALDTLDTLKSA